MYSKVKMYKYSNLNLTSLILNNILSQIIVSLEGVGYYSKLSVSRSRWLLTTGIPLRSLTGRSWTLQDCPAARLSTQTVKQRYSYNHTQHHNRVPVMLKNRGWKREVQREQETSSGHISGEQVSSRS